MSSSVAEDIITIDQLDEFLSECDKRYVNSDAATQNLNDAAKVATNYITETENNGITVHTYNDTNTYINIDDNIVDIVNSNISIFKSRIDPNEDKIRIGKETSIRMLINDDRLTISDTINDVSFDIATFGTNNDAFTLTNGLSGSDNSDIFLVKYNGRTSLGRSLTLQSDYFTDLSSEDFVGIYAQTKLRGGWALRVFGNNTDEYGNAIVMGDGGLFVAGAGESAENMYNAILASGSNQGREDAFLTADGSVFIVPNCNTIDNRIEYNFGSGGLNMKKKAISELNNIEFSPGSNTSNHGGFLDFHYNQSTADYTSRIIEDASGVLSIFTSQLTVKRNGGPTITAMDTGSNAAASNNGVSSARYPGLNIVDSASRIMSRMECVVQTDGSKAAYWYVRQYNTSGTNTAQKGIRMKLPWGATNVEYTVDDPANFRSAISAASTSAASQSAAGLMSATDKKKLDGIATGAQVNPGAASQSAAGLMSAADKKKLDGIATGAQVNPTLAAATSGIITAGSGITISQQQATIYASHVVQVNIHFKPTAAKSGNVTIGNLTANYRPRYQAGAQVAFGAAGSTGWVDTNGNCIVHMGNLTAGTEYYFWATFTK